MTESRTNDPVSEARGRPLTHAMLELIWNRPEGVSRAEIARGTGLARSTVSKLVQTLLDSGLIEETGDGPSSGGRRPVMLRFDDTARVILGVDMGASHLAVGLIDLRGNVLEWREVKQDVRNDPDGTCARIRELCDECLQSGPGYRDRLLGVGVAAPSPVDPRTPTAFPSRVLPAWSGHRGLDELADHLGTIVRVENDANAGALAEQWWGGFSDVPDFTFVKIATGLGAGHIVGGQLYRGATGVAGEIGHVSIDPNGEPCVCGNRGCVTTVVGSAVLIARAQALREHYPETALAAGDLTLADLERATLAGDPLAVRVVGEAAGHLGTVLAGLLNLMNPGALVLGGSLVRVGEAFLGPLREAVSRRTLMESVSAVELRTSQLGEQNIALGAATTVLAEALAHPHLFNRASAA